MNFWRELENELRARETRGLRRHLRAKPADCFDLASNDYLGLAHHPEVVAAAQNAAGEFGAGAGASRLVSGDYPLIRELENALARFKGAEAALVFSSGFAANLGVVGAFCEATSALFCHKRNHASLLDACVLASAHGAPLRFWETPEKLDFLLEKSAARRKIIVADAVFSMDGDLLPLPDVLALAEKHDALLILDDAHGTGTLGARGRGLEEHFGVKSERLVVVGTLSKALGSQGGFVVAPRVGVEFLVNAARSFVYSTGLNPAAAGAARQSLEIIEREPERVEKCRAHAIFLAAALRDLGFDARAQPTPILPVMMENEFAALETSAQLEKNGVWCPAIRPPTVKTARLRVTARADWTPDELARIVAAFRL